MLRREGDAALQNHTSEANEPETDEPSFFSSTTIALVNSLCRLTLGKRIQLSAEEASKGGQAFDEDEDEDADVEISPLLSYLARPDTCWGMPPSIRALRVIQDLFLGLMAVMDTQRFAKQLASCLSQDLAQHKNFRGGRGGGGLLSLQSWLKEFVRRCAAGGKAPREVLPDLSEDEEARIMGEKHTSSSNSGSSHPPVSVPTPGLEKEDLLHLVARVVVLLTRRWTSSYFVIFKERLAVHWAASVPPIKEDKDNNKYDDGAKQEEKACRRSGDDSASGGRAAALPFACTAFLDPFFLQDLVARIRSTSSLASSPDGACALHESTMGRRTKRGRDDDVDEVEGERLIKGSAAWWPSATAPGTLTTLALRDAFSLWRGLPEQRIALPGGLHEESCSSSSSSVFTYSTGCSALDAALHGSAPHKVRPQGYPSTTTTTTMRRGGVRSGCVTEIFGEAGTGKTQLALQLLCMEAARLLCRAVVRRVVATVFVSNAPAVDPESLEALHLWDAALHQMEAPESTSMRPGLPPDDVGGSVSLHKLLLYCVAEDVPAARLPQIAQGCIDKMFHLYFEDADSPWTHGRLPLSGVQAVQQAVREEVTVECVLEKLVIFRVRRGLAEVAELLDARSGRITRMLRAHQEFGADAQAAWSTGLLCIDSIAALSQQTTLETNPHRPNEWEEETEDTSIASLVRLLGDRMLRVSAECDAAFVVTNQIRAVYEDRFVTNADEGRGPLSLHALPTRKPGTGRCGPRPAAAPPTPAVTTPLGLTWAVVPHVRVALRRIQRADTAAARLGGGSCRNHHTIMPNQENGGSASASPLRWMAVESSPYSGPSWAPFAVTAAGVADA